MSDLEQAIFAAAFVDAMRNIYDNLPMSERIRHSEREASYMVSRYRKYRVHAIPMIPS